MHAFIQRQLHCNPLVVAGTTAAAALSAARHVSVQLEERSAHVELASFAQRSFNSTRAASCVLLVIASSHLQHSRDLEYHKRPIVVQQH
jgi:hypothetical protein